MEDAQQNAAFMQGRLGMGISGAGALGPIYQHAAKQGCNEDTLTCSLPAPSREHQGAEQPRLPQGEEMGSRSDALKAAGSCSSKVHQQLHCAHKEGLQFMLQPPVAPQLSA